MKPDQVQRLTQQVERLPHFDFYSLPSLDLAVQATIEKLEEQEYEEDKHIWCHERPILLTLLSALLDAQQTIASLASVIASQRVNP